MLKNVSFNRKMQIMVAVSIMALILFGLESYFEKRKLLVTARQDQISSVVEAATQVVIGYQAKVSSGEMTLSDAQKAAKDVIRTIRFGGTDGKTNYIAIFTIDGVSVMHPHKPEWAGQSMFGKVLDAAGTDTIKLVIDSVAGKPNGKGYSEILFPHPGEKIPVRKLMQTQRIDGWNWMLVTGLYMDDVEAHMLSEAWRDARMLLITLLLVGGASVVISKSVFRQIGGDPNLAMVAMAQVARGDLALEIAPAPKGSLLDGLHDMVLSLRRTVTQVRESAESIQVASSEVAAGNLDLSQRTEQAASNLQLAASSLEQLSGTVKQGANAARQATDVTAKAGEVAARGGSAMAQVVATMAEINASSMKISDIIGVIDGIAFQTNILALNAAVEAARAGEQGRGFAVVAAEVRSLAGRSADAAKEIKSLIGSSVERVEAGSLQVSAAGQTMEEIVRSVQSVSDMIGSITASASEQSTGISEVSTSVTDLDRMTQQNSALVEESASAAESLNDQAAKLAKVVDTFKLTAVAA